MEKSRLDFRYFQPEVLQAVAGKDYVVYAYVNDGSIRMVDMKPLINKDGVFKVLADESIFQNKITVINNAVSWDLNGERDEYNCIDIDPFFVFESPIVTDIPEEG